MKQIFFVLLLILAACSERDSKDPSISYALGQQIGKSFNQQGIVLNVSEFSAGVKDAQDGKNLNNEEIAKILSKLTLDRSNQIKNQELNNLKKSTNFLLENEKKDGVKSSSSGLQYKIIKKGFGKKITTSSVIEMDQVITVDDSVISDSKILGQTSIINLESSIKGLQEGLPLINEGGEIILFIPPHLGYETKAQANIPPNSLLIYHISVKSIK